MSTVRPLSARVTFFSSRLMLNTDLLEMSSLPCSSCPRTGSRRGPSKGSSYLINLTLDRSGGVKVEGDRGEAKQTRNMGNKTTEKCRSTGGGIDKPVQKQKAMLEIGEIGEYKRRSRMEKWNERETSLRYTEKKIEMRHYRQRTEKWKKTGYKENWVIYWTVLSQHYSVFLFKSESITQN